MTSTTQALHLIVKVQVQLIQPTTSKNCDPPPPPEYDTSTSSSTSQQSNSSNNNINGLITNTQPQFTFRSPSTPERSSSTTHPNTPAQTTTATDIPTTFNINMLHSRPSPNIVTSRTIYRPPIPTVPTNPLQYNFLVQIYILPNTLNTL